MRRCSAHAGCDCLFARDLVEVTIAAHDYEYKPTSMIRDSQTCDHSIHRAQLYHTPEEQRGDLARRTDDAITSPLIVALHRLARPLAMHVSGSCK